MDWLTYFAGVGLSWANLGGSYTNPSRSVAVDASLAQVRSPKLAVGAHLRVSHVEGWVGDRGGTGGVDTDYEFYTIDVAPMAQLTAGPVVIAPWVGLHVVAGTARTFYSDPAPSSQQRDIGPAPHLAVGVVVSVDVVPFGANRIAVYGEIEGIVATGDDPGTDTAAITVGLAYRR